MECSKLGQSTYFFKWQTRVILFFFQIQVVKLPLKKEKWIKSANYLKISR